jgi:hypothetical protein
MTIHVQFRFNQCLLFLKKKSFYSFPHLILWYTPLWQPSWFFRLALKTITGSSTEHSYNIIVKSDQWFLKFQPIRTYYWLWQPCWISDQHQKLKLCKVPPHIEHSSQVKLQWIKLFWKRILKCEKITGEDSQWMQIDDNSSQDPSDKMS